MAEYILVTPETLLWLEKEILPGALNGDFEKVKMLLRVLSYAVEQGVPLPAKLASFLAGALREISHGGNPGKAFCIKRPRGGRDTSAATEQAVRRVYKVKVLLQEDPSISVEDAIAQVAESEKASEFTILAAWRDYSKSVALSPDGLSGHVFFGKSK